MRKILFSTMLALHAACAGAQPLRTGPALTIEPQGGMSMILGEGSDYFAPGFGAGLTVLSSPLRRMQFGLSVNYNRFEVHTGRLEAACYWCSGYFDLDQTFSIIEIAPVARFALVSLEQNLVPFVQGGFGMYFSKLSTKAHEDGWDTRGVDSDKDFGLNAAGGFSIKLYERLRLQASSSYHLIFSGRDGEMRDEGFTSKYFTARGGLALAL